MVANYVRIGKYAYGAMRTSRVASKLVYSTGRSEKAATTLLDFFKTSALKRVKPQQLAADVFQRSTGISKEVESLLRPVGEKYGIFQNRVKALAKIEGKVPNAIRKIDGKSAVELIQEGKLVNVIGDGYGARVIFDRPKDVEKFIDELARTDKNFKILNLENYHGRGIAPYISTEGATRLAETHGIDIISSIKDAGYTRVNLNVVYKGIPMEIQLGGKYTTRFGEIEHYLYDMRGGANPDLSKLDDVQKALFHRMKPIYQQTMANKTVNGIYTDYLNDFWASLRAAEEKGLAFPAFPSRPACVPKILTIENLFRLEHV